MNKFLEEILEQPGALKKTLDLYLSLKGTDTLGHAEKMIKSEQYEQIIFTGMGSSYFTSYAASTLFAKAGISSFVINTSELLHYNFPILKKKTLLVCISQSGESYEVVELLKKLPDNVFSIGITNVENSTLAKKSDLALYSKAGHEDMTSTKTYVSILLVVEILSWYVAGQWDKVKIAGVSHLIELFGSCLNGYEQWVDKLLDFMGELNALQIIARGASYSTALQSALMFKEAVSVPAAGYLGGEFRHGPMEMVQEGFRSILFAPDGKTIDQNLKMAKDIARFGGKVLVITNIAPGFSDKNILVFPIEEKDEHLFAIQSIIPVQLMVDFYAKRRGFEAGSFSRGAKVTGVE